jgi:hypothetical protein
LPNTPLKTVIHIEDLIKNGDSKYEPKNLKEDIAHYLKYYKLRLQKVKLFLDTYIP